MPGPPDLGGIAAIRLAVGMSFSLQQRAPLALAAALQTPWRGLSVSASCVTTSTRPPSSWAIRRAPISSGFPLAAISIVGPPPRAHHPSALLFPADLFAAAGGHGGGIMVPAECRAHSPFYPRPTRRSSPPAAAGRLQAIAAPFADLPSPSGWRPYGAGCVPMWRCAFSGWRSHGGA